MKLIVDKSSGRVIGLHMVGPDAGEICQGMAVAMKAGATKADFDSTVGITDGRRGVRHNENSARMMDLVWWEIAILIIAGFGAGVVNVMAGGGSILTVPIMMFLGMPGPVWNGTNRITIVAHNASL